MLVYRNLVEITCTNMPVRIHMQASLAKRAATKNSRATQLSTKREGLGKPANVQPLIALQPRMSARKNVSKKKKTRSISYSTSTECEFA